MSVQEARKKIIEYKLCSYCGICTSLNTIQYCPQLHIDNELYEKPMPNYINVYKCRSKIEGIEKYVQDGGTVTTILVHLLRNKIVDAVVVVKLDKGYTPKPIITNDVNEVFQAGKSKYTYTSPLSLAKKIQEFNKVAIVGLPCHIRAVSKASEIRDKVIKIALICGHNFVKQMYSDLAKEYNFKLDDIEKAAIKGRNLRIILKTGNIIEKPLKELEKYVLNCCKQCPELISHYADIVVGSMFVEEGWNIVFTLTKLGDEIIQDCAKNNVLELSEVKQEIIEKIAKAARRKAENGRKFRTEIVEKLKEANLLKD